MSDVLEFSNKLKELLGYLPALLNFEKAAAGHTANIDRMKSDANRLIESYRLQGLAAAKEEGEVHIDAAKAEGRRLLADAQGKLDQVDAELRMKQKRLDAINGDIERGSAKLEEYHRVRRSLVG
jgi:hypothetical protein